MLPGCFVNPSDLHSQQSVGMLHSNSNYTSCHLIKITVIDFATSSEQTGSVFPSLFYKGSDLCNITETLLTYQTQVENSCIFLGRNVSPIQKTCTLKTSCKFMFYAGKFRILNFGNRPFNSLPQLG